jgi:hypothetical protein
MGGGADDSFWVVIRNNIRQYNYIRALQLQNEVRLAGLHLSSWHDCVIGATWLMSFDAAIKCKQPWHLSCINTAEVSSRRCCCYFMFY